MRFVTGGFLVLALALAGCTASSSDAAAIANAPLASEPVPVVACLSHPTASFARHGINVTTTEQGSAVEYVYWLQDSSDIGPSEGTAPVTIPDAASRWTLARDLECWDASTLASHLRPVRRVRPPTAETTVEPLVYCEGSRGSKQLLVQRETFPAWSAEGPVRVAEIVVLYDAPDLVQILPEPRRTILDTLYASYTDRITGAAGDQTFGTCTFATER